MPTGFQQQQPVRNNGFFKPAATPQHGAPADPKTAAVRAIEPRTFELKPQH
ncbi:hypothetical protein ACO2Q3_20210 [Caulobacter sp. KR2-114]|uniref:hypothetical protein n=1 Tax=Caulobacter sp. KR2-114 TaxID=3400912 RepID=UPI003C0884C8